MEKTNYGKYFLKEPLEKSRHPGSDVLGIQITEEITKVWGGMPLHLVMHAIYQPTTMGGEKGHTHESDEVIFFIGADPMNFRDFGAEAELTMGEEGEKHIVTNTTFVFIPRGLLHCPLVFKRVDKPILFGHIMFAPVYEAKDRAKISELNSRINASFRSGS